MENKEKLEVVRKLQGCGIMQYRLALEEVEKDLGRLEQIDNANPSEALESLIGLEKEITQRDGYITNFLKIKFDIIKQALLKAQEQDKILNILKKAYRHGIWELNEYFYNIQDGSDGYRQMEITEEQYDLINQWVEEH